MPRPTILVIEDHPEIRDRILHVITGEFDVVGIIDRGDEALQAAERLVPDIVLLDVSLPGLGGLKVLPAIRAVLPKAVIVMLTNHSSELYHHEAFERGADAYVLKHEVGSELIKAIRQGRARTSGQAG